MRSSLPARLSFVFLVVLLGVPGAVRAEWMSAWGHPVVSFGWTPYDAVSAGHGNYPGSHGFIPGYGYYPGIFPSHYPWYDGPDEHGHADPVPAVSGELAPAAEAAVLRLLVPADARLWINGQATVQGGTVRSFVSPPLPEGHQFFYDVLAVWVEDGKPLARRRKILVFPGDRLTVDIAAPDPEEPAVLGPPRKVTSR
jgi:uncharacterized protein (TIGR03000 family)